MQATLLTSFSDIGIQLKAAQSALYPDAILLSGVANTPSWHNRRRIRRLYLLNHQRSLTSAQGIVQYNAYKHVYISNESHANIGITTI